MEILFATYQFPNGGTGFWGVATGSAAPFRGPALATTPEAYLRYVVVMATLGFLFIEAHRRLFPGRAWALIRRSEAAAMAAGVNVTLYKAWAFGVAGLLAGAAGGLLAGSLGLLDDGTFRSSESIMLFALAVVGGSRYWLGAVIAAFLYRILPAAAEQLGRRQRSGLCDLRRGPLACADHRAGRDCRAGHGPRRADIRSQGRHAMIRLEEVTIRFGGACGP